VPRPRRAPATSPPAKIKALPNFARRRNPNNFKLQETHMAIERTLSIIKPDAVAKNVIGQIYARFEAPA
jgi:hypothetical protein